MSLVRALTASSLAISPFQLLAADLAGRGYSPDSGQCYVDTPRRRTMRALLDGAAVAQAVVKLGFLKTHGDLRYMVCRPVADADGTARYYTVQDLELSEARGNPVYRRVCLDTIAACEIQYRIPVQAPEVPR